jgi:hypothetical protein
MERPPASRALTGFFAAAVAALIFEQGMAGMLHAFVLRGMELPDPAYDMTPRAPFGTPTVLVHCFKLGLLGGLFGLVAPALSRPFWTPGLVMGLGAALITLFVLPQVQIWNPYGVSGEIPEHWPALLVLDLVWGFCTGAIYELLTPHAGGRFL